MQAQEEIKCGHEQVVLNMDLNLSPNKLAYCLHCKIEIEILKPQHLIHNFKIKDGIKRYNFKCGNIQCINCDEKSETAIPYNLLCQKCEKKYIGTNINELICDECKN